MTNETAIDTTCKVVVDDSSAETEVPQTPAKKSSAQPSLSQRRREEKLKKTKKKTERARKNAVREGEVTWDDVLNVRFEVLKTINTVTEQVVKLDAYSRVSGNDEFKQSTQNLIAMVTEKSKDLLPLFTEISDVAVKGKVVKPEELALYYSITSRLEEHSLSGMAEWAGGVFDEIGKINDLYEVKPDVVTEEEVSEDNES